LAKTDILNQLDNPEKNGIVTEEELLQRGVIYDSRRRIGEAQRGIFEDYRNTEESGLQRVFEDKISVPRGTSLVEETKIRETKGINNI